MIFFLSIYFFTLTNSSIKQVNASFDSPNESVVIKLALDTTEVAITRNGNREYAILDLAPFTQDGRTMVPLRFIAESFGAKLQWIEDSNNSGEGQIIITLTKLDRTRIDMKMHSLEKIAIIERYAPNSTQPETNQYEIEVAPFIVRPANRAVVPIRFIAEGFGATVNWFPETKEIEIQYSQENIALDQTPKTSDSGKLPLEQPKKESNSLILLILYFGFGIILLFLVFLFFRKKAKLFLTCKNLYLYFNRRRKIKTTSADVFKIYLPKRAPSTSVSSNVSSGSFRRNKTSNELGSVKENGNTLQQGNDHNKQPDEVETFGSRAKNATRMNKKVVKLPINEERTTFLELFKENKTVLIITIGNKIFHLSLTQKWPFEEFIDSKEFVLDDGTKIMLEYRQNDKKRNPSTGWCIYRNGFEVYAASQESNAKAPGLIFIVLGFLEIFLGIFLYTYSVLILIEGLIRLTLGFFASRRSLIALAIAYYFTLISGCLSVAFSLKLLFINQILLCIPYIFVTISWTTFFIKTIKSGIEAIDLQNEHKFSLLSDSLSIKTTNQSVPAIFDLGKLTPPEISLLSIFVVLPSESIEYSIIETLIGSFGDPENTLESLYKKGWIEFSPNPISFKCNQTAQEIVKTKNPNLAEDCKYMIKTLIEKLEYLAAEESHNTDFDDAELYARYAESIVQSLSNKNYEIAILCNRIGNYFQIMGNYEKALTYFTMCNEYEKELYNAHPSDTKYKNSLAVSYYRLGKLNKIQLKDGNMTVSYFKIAEQLWIELIRDFPTDKKYKNNLKLVQKELKRSTVHNEYTNKG